MTLDVRYHPEAVAEFRADVSWYEERAAGFPYRLVYPVQATDRVVVALAHEKRKPGYWRERLTSA